MTEAKALHWIDWVCVFVYGSGLLGIALFHMRSIRKQDDVFLAGRSMGKWPIAFSMYMALFSTNTFLGVTGWLNRPEGTIWIGLKVISALLAVPVVIWLYPTLFYRLRITTAYEYLDKRFSPAVRGVATLFFIGSRVMWMGIMLYASSLVVSKMFGWTDSFGASTGQVWAIILMGALSTAFAALGGMRAVIWTDTIQFFVMMVGLIVMMVYGTYLAGGPSEVLQIGLDAGKFAPPAFFSLTDDLSIMAALALGFFGYLSSGGSDQVVLQTYLSAKSDKVAKASLWSNGIFLKPLSLIYPVLGVIMFAYYQTHPASASLMKIPDDALPVFVITVLPVGLTGIMVAAIMAAVLTSIDSGLTALSAAIQTDYLRRRKHALNDREAVTFARGLLLVCGIVVTIAAIWIETLGGDNNIIQIINIVMYPFSGVLLGIFLLGILTTRANATGVLVGGVIGIATTISVPLLKVTLSESLQEGTLGTLLNVSNFYYGFIGTMVTVLVGYSVSLLLQRPPESKTLGLTRWSLPPDPDSSDTAPAAESRSASKVGASS